MAKSRSKNQDGKGDKVFDIDMSSGFDDAWQKSRDEGIVDDGKSKSDGWFSMRELLEEQSKKETPLKISALKNRISMLKNNGCVEVDKSIRIDAAGRWLSTPVYKFKKVK